MSCAGTGTEPIIAPPRSTSCQTTGPTGFAHLLWQTTKDKIPPSPAVPVAPRPLAPVPCIRAYRLVHGTHPVLARNPASTARGRGERVREYRAADPFGQSG